MDLNLVVLMGRVTCAPEHRVFESGGHLLRILVAVKSDHPRRRLDIVPVVLWDPPSDLCDGGLPAGTRVWITGSVQRRYWDGTEGRRSRLEVVAHHVLVCDDHEPHELPTAVGSPHP